MSLGELKIPEPVFTMTPTYETIAKLYPRLFGDDSVIEIVHDGWSKLINEVFFLLDKEVEYMPEDIAGGIKVTQVKTKFGGLRIYMTHTTPFIRGAIAMAEQMSYSICEHCGDAGEMRNIGGFSATLCAQHHREETNRRINVKTKK